MLARSYSLKYRFYVHPSADLHQAEQVLRVPSLLQRAWSLPVVFSAVLLSIPCRKQAVAPSCFHLVFTWLRLHALDMHITASCSDFVHYTTANRMQASTWPSVIIQHAGQHVACCAKHIMCASISSNLRKSQDSQHINALNKAAADKHCCFSG